MKMLTTKELALRWQMAIGSLENWRQQDKGPKFIKMGGAKNADVRYPIEHVVAFEKKNLR